MSAAVLMPLPDPDDEPGPVLAAAHVPVTVEDLDGCDLDGWDLDGCNLSGWDDDRLVAEITSVERQSRALAARAVRLAAEFARRHPETSEGPTEDDLSRAALDELSVASGLARGAYAYRLRDAVELDRRFPRLRDAWEAGLLPSAAVRKVLELTAGLSEPSCPRVESDLLTRLGRPTHDLAAMSLPQLLALDDDTAMTVSSRATTARVGQLVRDALVRIEPAARAQRVKAAKAARRVWFDPQGDEMGVLGGSVPQALGWAGYERIDAIARSLPDHPDDTRSLDAKRADVLMDLVLGTQVERPGELGSLSVRGPAVSAGPAVQGGRPAPATDAAPSTAADGSEPGRARPPVERPAVASVNLHVLLDHSRCRPGAGGCPGEAGRLGPVTAETVVDLLQLATDTGGRVHGGHITEQQCPGAAHHEQLGPGPYEPGEALKRFLRARHRRCVWPGCDRPARSCELDHSRPHPEGPTCECNLAPECTYHHHQVKHHPGRAGRPPWRLVNHGRGHLTWITPGGRRIDVWPDPPDPPPAPCLDPPPF